MKIKEAIEWMKQNPMKEMVCVAEGTPFKTYLLRFNSTTQITQSRHISESWRDAYEILMHDLDWEPVEPTDEYEECDPKDAELVRIPAQEFRYNGGQSIVLNGWFINDGDLKALNATYHRKKPEPSIVEQVMSRFYDKPDYTFKDIERILKEELGGGK